MKILNQREKKEMLKPMKKAYGIKETNEKLSSWDLWNRKDEGLIFYFKVQLNKSNLQINYSIPNTRQSSCVIFKSGSTVSMEAICSK